MFGNKAGFLLIEILIASLILTSSIAATMYLFRVGQEHLARADVSNVLSVKLQQAVSLLDTIDLASKSGAEDMGDGVTLDWQAELLAKTTPAVSVGEENVSISSPFNLLLYKVDFTLQYSGNTRDYEINMLRYKSLS